jgi:iron complex outermembrane recepter protein
MRVGLAVALACLTLGGLAAAGDATAAIRKETDIPAEGLGPALTKLAKEFDFQVLYRTEIVSDLKSPGAMGTLTSDEALSKVLAGTGLTYKYLDDKTVTIVPMSAAAPSQTSSQSAPESSDDAKEVGKKPSRSFRMAQVDQGTSVPVSGSAANGPQTNSEQRPSLEEVIVTAQKKTERALDVPVPMTVLDGQTIAQNGQARIEDYFATVPGLSFAGSSSGGGTQFITIRGLATSDYQTPTVGTIIDDVPIGDSLGLNYGADTYPDVDPSDLAQIEVLKGPQGTLYGADSIGGVIKFDFKDPSTDGYSGNVQALGNDVNAGGAGYAVRASANVPVSDTFAFRASAFSRRDGGFIDNLYTDQHDTNSVDSYGFHLATLWRPLDGLSLKLSALVQIKSGDGAAEINTNSSMQPTLGNYGMTGILGDESFFDRLQVYAATLKARLGDVDLTSVSGYSINSFSNMYDSTGYNSSEAQSLYGVTGATDSQSFSARKLTQEIRATSTSFQKLDWLGGLFFTHENTVGNIPLEAVNATTAAPAGPLINFHDGPIRLQEYAVFGDLTYHFTDQFNIQLGARESYNRITYDETDTGPLTPSFDNGATSPDIYSTEHAKGHAFTYLVTPQFKFSRELMAYARVASGYRIGGPNLPAVGNFGLPTSFKPDTTTNYELGLKGSALDQTLTFDLSAYYIDWKDIQISEYSPAAQATYTGNGGKAKSEGFEAQVQAKPMQVLKIAASASVNNARLTQNLPTEAESYALAGSRLPYTARFTGSLSAELETFHVGGYTGLMGATVSYIGDRELEFAYCQTCIRFEAPSYTTLNMHLGVTDGSWYWNLFVNNATNALGVTSGGYDHAIENTNGYYASVIAPRTIGLSISKSF